MGNPIKNIGTNVVNAFKNPTGYLENVIKHPQNLIGMGAFSPYKGTNLGTSTDTPFSLSPEEIEANRQAILKEGEKQFGQTGSLITSEMAKRADARQKLGELLTSKARATFADTLPDIAESANAAHLYDSTGYGAEVAREQGRLARDIASEMGTVGLKDIYDEGAKREAQLAALQGMQTGALERGFSLEDFIREANISKAIGAQLAPKVSKGKAETGSVLEGVGALAPLAKILLA